MPGTPVWDTTLKKHLNQLQLHSTLQILSSEMLWFLSCFYLLPHGQKVLTVSVALFELIEQSFRYLPNRFLLSHWLCGWVT